jgi:HPt (histidine-containing phosphotransfer) domain-containing protein
MIRNSSPRIAAHYCVALTASSYEDQRDRLIKLGFDEFLSKPLSMAELSDTLAFVSNNLRKEAPIESVNDVEKQNEPQRDEEYDLSYFKAQFADAAEMVFIEIAPTFLENTASDFKLLNTAIEQNRVESIRNLSHSIKGASLSLGLNGLASCLEKIEHKPGDSLVHETFASAQELWLTAERNVGSLLDRFKREAANA